MQLQGFSRGIAEMQWLLVALVLFYLALADPTLDADTWPAIGVTGAYFAFCIGAALLTRLASDRRWPIALHSWAMIGFITALLYTTSGIDTPLVSLYLLPVIAAALALGRTATLLQVCAVAACYLWLLHHLGGAGVTAETTLAFAGANVVMFLLVGYLTTVLADAIKLANDRLRQLAHTDPLTGLYNRGTLHAVSAPLQAAAARDDQPFSVLLADMDNLKETNDRLGHDAGDRAIVIVADRLRASLRGSDVIARYGGDEFVAVLPGTDCEGAVRLANRVLTAIERAGEGPVRPRLSIGVAGTPMHGGDIEALLRRADAAMYRAKKAGGQRVEIATAGEPAAATPA